MSQGSSVAMDMLEHVELSWVRDVWLFSSKVCDTKRGNQFNDLARLKKTESSAEKMKRR